MFFLYLQLYSNLQHIPNIYMGNQFSEVPFNLSLITKRSTLSFNNIQQTDRTSASFLSCSKSLTIKSLDQLQYYKNIFNFRLKHKNLLTYCYGFEIQDIKQNNLWNQLQLNCNQNTFSVKIKLHFEQIIQIFSDLYQISINQGFILLANCLKGFSLLYDKFGYFVPQARYIVKQGNEWKVWINQNVLCVRTKILQKRNINNVTKQKFIQQVIHLFDMLRNPQFPYFSYSSYVYNSFNNKKKLDSVQKQIQNCSFSLQEILSKINHEKIMSQFYGIKKFDQKKKSLRRISADLYQTIRKSDYTSSHNFGGIVRDAYMNDATLPKFTNNNKNKQHPFKRKSQSSHCAVFQQTSNINSNNIKQPYNLPLKQFKRPKQHKKSFSQYFSHSKNGSIYSNQSVNFKASIFKQPSNRSQQTSKLFSLNDKSQKYVHEQNYQIPCKQNKKCSYEHNRCRQSLSTMMRNEKSFKRVSSKFIHQYLDTSSCDVNAQNNKQPANHQYFNSNLYNPSSASSPIQNQRIHIRQISQPSNATSSNQPTIANRHLKNRSSISTPSNCTLKSHNYTPIKNTLRKQFQNIDPHHYQNLNSNNKHGVNLCSNCECRFIRKQRSYTVNLTSSSNSNHQYKQNNEQYKQQQNQHNSNNTHQLPQKITQNSETNSQSQENYHQQHQKHLKDNNNFKQAFLQSQPQIRYDTLNSQQRSQHANINQAIQIISENPTKKTPSIARNTKPCGQQTMKYLKKILINHAKFQHKRSLTDNIENSDNKIKFCLSQEFDSSFFSNESYCNDKQEQMKSKIEIHETEETEKDLVDDQNLQDEDNLQTVQRNPTRHTSLQLNQREKRQTIKTYIAFNDQQQRYSYKQLSDRIRESQHHSCHPSKKSTQNDRSRDGSRVLKQTSIARIPILKSQRGLKSLLTNKLSTLKSIKQIQVQVPIDQQILSDLNKMFTKHRFCKSTKLTK